jgi:hypothetical protein
MWSPSTAERSFDPASLAGLSDEARSAVNAAFDAMATWRAEIVSLGEQGLEQVRRAGAPMAGPDRRGDLRANASRLQTIDNDAWEQQIRSASPSSAMLSKLRFADGSPTDVFR